MKKILIVDDEPVMLKIADYILSKEYETVCASSGSEAIEIYAREHPDMVLSDLLMPEMDGYELQRRLMEIGGEPVPFMLMTADESDESESRGFELGAADYIRKPFRANVLLQRISKILQHVDKIHGLKKAASLDPLTGMLNKEASRREIEERCQSVPGALLMIDLDSFKNVNDLYGHSMGDRILVSFANLLQSLIRDRDVAGRIGGDEFIAYLQNIREKAVIKSKVHRMNEEILQTARDLMGENMSIPLGVSVGVVFAPDEGTNFSELSHKADQALYRVKNHGKHGVDFFVPAEAGQVAGRTDMVEGLSGIRQILGERQGGKKALFLEFAQFRLIYRFLQRWTENYSHKALFLRLTLPIREGQESVAEGFADTLQNTLRRSDCITQSSPGQFLVLLMEAGEWEGTQVMERMHSNWMSRPEAAGCMYECEMEAL